MTAWDSNPEDIAREILKELQTKLPTVERPGESVANPPGMLSSNEQWGNAHPDAVAGLTRAMLGATADPVSEIPAVGLVVPVVEAAQAWARLGTDRDFDAFLDLRAPRIFAPPGGTGRWTLLTPITDRVTLTRELLGSIARRPHHRDLPPVRDLHLQEAHASEDFRSATGMSLRQALDLDRVTPRERARRVFTPLLGPLAEHDRGTAAGLRWLAENAPEALADLPVTSLIADALQGSTETRVENAMRFVHLLEIEGVGFCAVIVWDPAAALTRKDRVALAGYIRKISDEAVQPWNRWDDLRTRREALMVWGRHVMDEAIEAEVLADYIRGTYPNMYHEPRDKTVRRIYRISTELSDVTFSAVFRDAARTDSNRARSA